MCQKEIHLEMEISFTKLLLYSFLLHIILILYGLIQDTYFSVKYTDVDYWVFWEAANNWIKSGDPFLQPVYRYTPLIGMALGSIRLLQSYVLGKNHFLVDRSLCWMVSLQITQIETS